MKLKKTLCLAFAGLMAASCATNQTAIADVSGIHGEWQITHANGMSTKEGTEPATITFSSDGKVNGCATVNRFFGDYDYNGRALTFGHMGLTRMMGMGHSMEIERNVIDALNTTKSASVSKDKATLYNEKGEKTLVLKRK